MHDLSPPPTVLTARDRHARRALGLARALHLGQLDSRGQPVLEHVLRVALSVHTGARPLALVHEICARSDYSPRHVTLELGLDRDAHRALELLTPEEGEELLEHVDRVVESPPGGSWELAVAVMRADVADHLQRGAGDVAANALAIRRLQAVAGVAAAAGGR